MAGRLYLKFYFHTCRAFRFDWNVAQPFGDAKEGLLHVLSFLQAAALANPRKLSIAGLELQELYTHVPAA